MRSMKLFFDENDLDFDGYIYLNGQCGSYQGKDVRNVYLPEDEVRNALGFILEHRIQTNIHVDKETVTALDGDEHRVYQIPLCDFSKLNYSHIHQISVMLPEGEMLEEVKKIMKSCEVTRWSRDGVDIILAGSGKIEGMKAILDSCGLSFQQVISFGDSENDVEMLKLSKVGIAMGNAMEVCKIASDYVTDDMYHDGIFNALKHFGFLE